MNPKLAQLKIKIKSLSEEIRMIRRDEIKYRDGARRSEAAGFSPNLQRGCRVSLYEHRTLDLKAHARAAMLAYAFLRGREYAKVEKPKPGNKIWSLRHCSVGEKVLQNVKRFKIGFDEKTTLKELSGWLDTATVAV